VIESWRVRLFSSRSGQPRRSLVLIFVSILSSGCSPRTAAEALFLGDQFTLTSDLVYGESDRNRLDVYRPRGARDPAPVVVFLYGGRWQSGSKEDYRLLGDALTKRGVAVVVPDYHLYPAAEFPDWVEDAALVVRWTLDNIRRFGGDPDRIILVGHSAGAHTAVLLALDEGYLERAGASNVIRGFVSLAGPVNTTWTDDDVQALMGPQAGWPSTYPVNHIDGTEPPILLLHGSGDETVSPENSVSLAARIRDRGGCARAVLYPSVGHIEIVVALAIPWLRIAPVLDHVAAFVDDPIASTCPARAPRGPTE
jgi:acetyl esterase/lipase